MVAPGALVFRPLVKANEDSGNEIETTTKTKGCAIVFAHMTYDFIQKGAENARYRGYVLTGGFDSIQQVLFREVYAGVFDRAEFAEQFRAHCCGINA